MDDVRNSGERSLLPHYQRLKVHIVDQISCGKLRPGQRIPSEGDLVKSFAVSRMTANRALRELESEGFITRVQGVGSFVATSKSESTVLAIRNIADEIRARHQRHTSLVVQLGEAREPRFNRLLGLPDRTAHFRSVLVHHADDVPLQLEDRRVNPAFAPDYLQQDFTQVTPNAHLMAQGALQYAEHIFEAELPSGPVARLLQIRRSEPCIVLRRRTWSLGMVASFAVITAPSSRYRYTGSFGSAPTGAQVLPPI
jgi:GntR family histidine utilization transcriptional repressor